MPPFGNEKPGDSLHAKLVTLRGLSPLLVHRGQSLGIRSQECLHLFSWGRSENSLRIPPSRGGS